MPENQVGCLQILSPLSVPPDPILQSHLQLSSRTLQGILPFPTISPIDLALLHFLSSLIDWPQAPAGIPGNPKASTPRVKSRPKADLYLSYCSCDPVSHLILRYILGNLLSLSLFPPTPSQTITKNFSSNFPFPNQSHYCHSLQQQQAFTGNISPKGNSNTNKLAEGSHHVFFPSKSIPHSHPQNCNRTPATAVYLPAIDYGLLLPP